MTDFLRSILQTAHNANVQHSGATASSTHAAAAAAAVKTEVRPVDQIQVPPTVCVTADASASLLAMEKQRMIKVEIPETTTSVATTNVLSADAGKAQRAARRDVVNARRETKRKTMSVSSPSPSGAVDGEAVTASAASSPSSVVDMTASETATVTVEKSKKMKTGKTTSANVSSCVEPDAKSAKKSAASSPSSSSSNSFLSCGSMLFGSEIDALGEERLRQMELQLESLDPDSKEAKKKRRLIRNRMSAQLHRERKKAYVGQLEDQLMEKEHELKALQEKLDAFAKEQQLLQQKLQSQTQPAAVAATVAPITVAAPAAAVVQIEDDVVIKTEPIVDVASAFEAAPTPTAAAKDNWDYCFSNLEDTEMADVAADDLLRDFDHPFAAYTAMGGDQQEMPQQHHEIHAAKKNLVMVMGMMFSATFFGNSPFFFDVQSGSNYSSFFNANPPKEFSQMNIASKIMSSLEKSSWKDFRDIASWTQSTAASAAAEPTTDAEDEEEETDVVVPAAAVASSPSAASDITDSSGTYDSPAQINDCLGLSGFETDLIDEFVYPVDDPFAPALADTNWFGDDADDFGQSDVDDNDDESVKEELFLSEVHLAEKKESSKVKEQQQQQSITSRLFEKLTTLWHEKNQVLLTVVDGKNEVTSRSVADMSSIRKSMENGSIFSNPLATAQASGSGAAKTSPLSNDQSVSFLYPLSAFSPAMEEKEAAAASDVMFLEVSCQMSALSM